MKPLYSFLYLILCCATLGLSSCNNCESVVSQFENGDSTWTVYNQGDTLRMVDNTDTVRVFINSQVNSELIPADGFSLSDECIEQYYTRRTSIMQHASNPRRFPGLTVVALRTPETIRVNLVVVNRGDFPIPDINNPQLDELTLEGVTYRDVFDLTVEEPGTPSGLSRIQFNREFGFLHVEYADGRTLTRIP